ncbi:MAG: hypothetical protein CM1200mP30_07830 [Pseudomonadota bacterium]|nr:MAG: hypothetical protein CM1200mP30_07830 [Pseudomonadota bacterium]
MDQVHDIFASQIRAGNEIIPRRHRYWGNFIIHQVDMQFQGQTHILNFPVEPQCKQSALHRYLKKHIGTVLMLSFRK